MPSLPLGSTPAPQGVAPGSLWSTDSCSCQGGRSFMLMGLRHYDIADVTERDIADRSTTWKTTSALSEPEAMSLLSELGFGEAYARSLDRKRTQARGGTSMST